MRLHYKNKDLLKNQPFYSDEIKSSKKRTKILVISTFYLNYPLFLKNIQNSLILNYQKSFYFSQKQKKRPKTLTKHQIRSNILPIYDSVGISRRKHALKCYAGTYDVQIIDRIILAASLFLAKSTIINWFKDILWEKRGFKYNLEIKVTLKRSNNTISRFDIATIYIKTNAIPVTNEVVI